MPIEMKAKCDRCGRSVPAEEPPNRQLSIDYRIEHLRFSVSVTVQPQGWEPVVICRRCLPEIVMTAIATRKTEEEQNVR